MKFKSNFKIIAPASISNLACGLDALGLALETPQDEIIVKPIDKPGIHIVSILNNKTKIPLDTNKNAAGISAQLLLDFLKKEHNLEKDSGLSFSINKKVAVGHGLGSSSASAVGGAFAVNEAFGSPLTKRELLPFAAQAEQIVEKQFRINSILPSLLGGIILTRDHANYDFHRLPLIRGLHIVVIAPTNIIMNRQQNSTKLPSQINLKSAIQQSANLAALIQAFYTSDLELLSRSLTDHLAEAHWKDAIPYFEELKDAALKNKALGCSLAGSGSGVFALCKNSLEAEQVAEAMKDIYSSNKIRHSIIVSKINHTGVQIA